GLEIYERLVPQAWHALKPHGLLALEIGHGQQQALARLLSDWEDVGFIEDLQRIPRVALALRS
ncbi:MAG: peptide chain release factor N(5)-glutamine methyltransferase, partial [Acidobacteriota bacterium]|nr:peptide chain release factor N(5)-glutamine methyltransferase [Acidobacteriota bacterium]